MEERGKDVEIISIDDFVVEKDLISGLLSLILRVQSLKYY